MDIALISAVNSTLDCIEVKGRENLRHMLGCMDALDSLIREESAQKNTVVSSSDCTDPCVLAGNINDQEVDNG